MKKKQIIFILAVITVILTIPLIAMQVTDEVNWNPLDFLVAGLLLLVAGLSVSFAWLRLKKVNTKITAIIVILIVFMLIWAELALGIFGSPAAGN